MYYGRITLLQRSNWSSSLCCSSYHTSVVWSGGLRQVCRSFS